MAAQIERRRADGRLVAVSREGPQSWSRALQRTDEAHRRASRIAWERARTERKQMDIIDPDRAARIQRRRQAAITLLARLVHVGELAELVATVDDEQVKNRLDSVRARLLELRDGSDLEYQARLETEKEIAAFVESSFSDFSHVGGHHVG